MNLLCDNKAIIAIKSFNRADKYRRCVSCFACSRMKIELFVLFVSTFFSVLRSKKARGRGAYCRAEMYKIAGMLLLVIFRESGHLPSGVEKVA